MAFPNKIKQRAIELSNEGYSARNLLEVLIKEFKDEIPIPPDERTIRRWRKEEQPRILPSVPENWEEHNAKLLGVAGRLLDNDLKRMMKWLNQKGEIEYPIYDEDETQPFQKLTADELVCQFEQNTILAYNEFTEWFFNTCFLPHLYAEWPKEFKNKGFYRFSEDQPYQLIEILRVLTERKTFKGTCPVCKDWQ